MILASKNKTLSTQYANPQTKLIKQIHIILKFHCKHFTISTYWHRVTVVFVFFVTQHVFQICNHAFLVPVVSLLPF